MLFFICLELKSTETNQLDGNIWIQADDEKTKILTEEEMNNVLNSGDTDGYVTHTPYMLFYCKNNM